MYNIDPSILIGQSKSIAKRFHYFAATLNDDAQISVRESLSTGLHTVNGWDLQTPEKAKWYSRALMKPIENYKAKLVVYDNGLVFYEIRRKDNSIRPSSAHTVSNIFGIGIQECFVPGYEDKYNAILTEVLVGLNRVNK